MTAAVENLRAIGTPAYLERRERRERVQAELQAMDRADARARAWRTLGALDLSEIACSDELVAAVKRRDPTEAGRVLLAAVDAWLEGVADHAVGGVA